MSESLRNTARTIFAEALNSVDVREAVRAHLAMRDGHLALGERTLPLDEVDRVLIVAIGKAAVPMYQAAAEQLDGVRHCAVVVAPESTLPEEATTDRVPRSRGFLRERDQQPVYMRGAHPTPTQDSLDAADAILNLLAYTTDKTAVLFLVSGGASAMVERPLSPAITLDDLAAFSRALVGSGMGITEMNTLRKHLSIVKGGRLAAAAAGARMQCTLLVSDVPAASPEAIASGPSLPDAATAADARKLFGKLKEGGSMPASVVDWFDSPALPETPKPGDAAFARAHWQVILSSDHLARAAARAAEAAGFHAAVDNTPDDWDYRDAARYLLGRSAAMAREHGRICLISVGEVGVTLPADHGEGGRNQQFALWCAAELSCTGDAATVLSAGSDGVDGHSTAAGAVCDETTSARAAKIGLDAEAALRAFDVAPLLRAVNDAIITGPTGTNLRDLRLVLRLGAVRRGHRRPESTDRRDEPDFKARFARRSA